MKILYEFEVADQFNSSDEVINLAAEEGAQQIVSDHGWSINYLLKKTGTRKAYPNRTYHMFEIHGEGMKPVKRSEAVLLIAESLVDPRHSDPMIEADNILQRLEKLGMLPPYYTQYLDHGNIQDCQWWPEEQASSGIPILTVRPDIGDEGEEECLCDDVVENGICGECGQEVDWVENTFKSQD